jgi:hypothetical protein
MGALNTPTNIGSHPHDLNKEADLVSETFKFWATASKISVKTYFPNTLYQIALMVNFKYGFLISNSCECPIVRALAIYMESFLLVSTCSY